MVKTLDNINYQTWHILKNATSVYYTKYIIIYLLFKNCSTYKIFYENYFILFL